MDEGCFRACILDFRDGSLSRLLAMRANSGMTAEAIADCLPIKEKLRSEAWFQGSFPFTIEG
jgi:hypothetical protein